MLNLASGLRIVHLNLVFSATGSPSLPMRGLVAVFIRAFMKMPKMAEGHNISSTSLNENLQDSASSMNESVRIQSSFVNDTKYCNMTGIN